MSQFQFRVSIDTDDVSGEVLAVYFQIRKGKVHKTLEFAEGNVFADYDRQGCLLGMELLGPCRASIVDKLAPKEPAELRSRAKRFMKNTGPRTMVAA